MYLVSPVTKRNTLEIPHTYQRQMKILNLRFPPKTISTILKNPGGDDCILVSGGFRSKYTTPPYLPRKVRLELEQQMKEKKMREDAGRCLAMFLQRAPPAYQKKLESHQVAMSISRKQKLKPQNLNSYELAEFLTVKKKTYWSLFKESHFSMDQTAEFVTTNWWILYASKHDLQIWQVICEIGASYRQHRLIMSLSRISYEEKW